MTIVISQVYLILIIYRYGDPIMGVETNGHVAVRGVSKNGYIVFTREAERKRLF